MRPNDAEEQRKPLSGENAKAQELVDLFNERSLVWEDEEKTVFLFDYAKGTASRGEIINRLVLKTLKERGQWRVVRHPLVLNFVNEKLLSCALFYLVHIFLYFVFLALLFSYVHGPPSVAKNLLVSAILLFFVFFMLVKAALKLQSGIRAVSAWFLISYTWTLITYSITLLFIWSWHLFSFDNYNEEIKRTIGWLLPIVATLASWINCLYVLRKAPCGSYILMMSKILFSFLNTTIIWIPTLATFAFAFMLVMRDSGTAPWDDQEFNNTTSVLMALFQSFTKTSAMMIGEVEANDILGRKAWVANFLLILFEIITVILLMNLMVSLAVGDVNDLRINAEDRMLRIKVNFCIEALHLSEQISFLSPWVRVLHRTPTNNILVIHTADNIVHSRLMPNIHEKFFGTGGSSTKMPTRRERVYDVMINSIGGLKLRKEQSTNRATLMSINGCTLQLVESTPGGIRRMESAENVPDLEALGDTESLWRKFQRWLIGLNWKALLFS
uniref:Ion_trans domain-containing protein n=1 Tax=Globodera pallida TaxID=36090 RepID=A0A183BVF2_GLOPA